MSDTQKSDAGTKQPVKGGYPGTAGSGETKIGQETGQGEGKVKPSSPGETGTTPGTNWK